MSETPFMDLNAAFGKDTLNEKVQAIVAMELGQRVVDHMDLRIGTKEIAPAERSDE